MICRVHKTFRTYGEAGKYVPEALARAFKVWVQFKRDGLDDPRGFWLNGCSAGSMAKRLHKFGEVMHMAVLFNATLMRKVFVTDCAEIVGVDAISHLNFEGRGWRRGVVG